MARVRGLSGLVATVLVACFACSLLVETEDIDARCPGQKECDGKCVNFTDPAYGCGTLCEPCQLINAIPKCEDGVCEVEACLFGFGCESSTGCETYVRYDPLNCGECGVPCKEDHSCQNGQCVAD